MDSSELVTGL